MDKYKDTGGRALFPADDRFGLKLADVLRVPYPYVAAMRDHGVLDMRECVAKLVREDCEALSRSGKFTRSQLLKRLAGIYGVDEREIDRMIATKTRLVRYCRVCGAEMSKTKYMRSRGLCDRCAAASDGTLP